MHAKEEQTKSVYKELITVEVAAEKIAGTDGTEEYLNNIKVRLQSKDEFKGADYEIKNGNTLVITTKEGYKYAVVGDKVILADDDNNGTGGSGDSEIPVIKEEEIKFKTIPTYWVNTGVTLEITSPKHPTLNVEYTDDETKLNADVWTEYTGKVSIDNNKTIYARLRNEAGPSEIYGVRNIENIDKTAPILTAQSFKVTNSSTRGFTAELEVQDKDSGLAQITWSYKLKSETKWNKGVTDVYHNLHTNDAGSKEINTKSHSFDKLSSGVYEVQANIYDVAGNITSTGPIEVNIGKIEDLEKDNVVGSYSYKPSYWTNESVTVTLPTIPDFETRYTTDGSLPNTSSSKYDPKTPIVVTNNCRIYYIYTDGVNVTKYATKEITNIDKDKMAIRTALREDASQKTTKSFAVNIQVEDEPALLAGRSGLCKIDWFYKLSGSGDTYQSITSNFHPMNSETSGKTGKTTESVVIPNLRNGTYEVYVDIYDVAGNVTSTKATPETVELGTMAIPNSDKLSYEPTYLTDGDVTVKLPVPEGEFGIKYSTDGTLPTLENFASLKDYFDPFTVSENSTIYFVYTDGTNISKVGTKNITNIDKSPAVISNFTATALNTSSFKLSATVQDSESGIGKIVFGYKHQNDSGYTEKVWSNPDGLLLREWKSIQAGEKGVINAEETFTGMRSGSYDCYVKVFNTATSDDAKASKQTDTVVLEGLVAAENGSYSPTTWTNGNVTVTLPEAPAGLTTRYTIDGSLPTPSSPVYTGPVTVESNCTINYVYTDGTNIGKVGSMNVGIIDKTGATIAKELYENAKTTKTITVAVNTQDSLSGLGKIVWYINKGGTWSSVEEVYTTLNGATAGNKTTQTKTHTFTGLTQNTEYKFYVEIYDVAGNKVESKSASSPLAIRTAVQAVTGFSISPNSAQTKNIGDSFTVTPTITPSDANDKTINWSSSNSSVATVSSSSTNATGITVRAVSAGTTTITATAVGGSGKTASFSLTVRNPLNSLTLSKDQTTILKDGYTAQITATTDPSDYSASNITWTIADTSIATVSVSGKTATITSKSKVGQTTLTVSAGGITKTVSISVVNFVTTTYSYTGNVQQVDLPAGTYKLEVWGAESGRSEHSSNTGKGGYSVGTITLHTNEKVYVYVGGKGGQGNASGGYNGGGRSYNSDSDTSSGGGASDIRISTDSLFSRVIVAGGGGGPGCGSCTGGAGGGSVGGQTTSGDSNLVDGGGGTTTAGGSNNWRNVSATYAGKVGSFGKGGDSSSSSSWGGGAGGGGWYGGGGGGHGGSGAGSGGGGSGWVYTETNYNTWKAGNSTDANKYLLNSSYYLTNASTSTSSHTGNGQAKITPVT